LLLIACIPISGLSADATALAAWPLISGSRVVLIYACLRGRRRSSGSWRAARSPRSADARTGSTCGISPCS
jgi:hypothetical protein